MSDGLNISEISLQNDLKRMQAISHNLANVNTPGYKQQILRAQGFDEVLDISLKEQSGSTGMVSISVQKPVLNSVVDTHTAALKYTGDPLDLALSDNIYYSVMTAQGEAYSRQGDLHIDARGRLVNVSGLPVMGMGGEIRLTTDKPLINQQGQIYVNEQLVGQLRLVKIPVDSVVSSLGGSLYKGSKSIDVSDQEGLVHQGFIEASNVNMTDEMVKMIELTRHFESSQRVVRGYDQMLDSAINIIGDMQN